METMIALVSFIGLVAIWALLPVRASEHKVAESVLPEANRGASDGAGILLPASSSTAQS